MAGKEKENMKRKGINSVLLARWRKVYAHVNMNMNMTCRKSMHICEHERKRKECMLYHMYEIANR